MVWRMALIALLMSTAPAFAFDTTKLGQGGSLPLEDVQPVIEQSSKLRREVDEAIAKADKKPADIICDAMRFPSSWKALGGTRVGPYHCQIGNRWLTIRTQVRVFDPRGKLYQSINQKGMNRADVVKESHPTWVWSDKAPE